MRHPGMYAVRFRGDTMAEFAFWNGTDWLLPGNIQKFSDKAFELIHQQRTTIPAEANAPHEAVSRTTGK